MPYEKQTWIDGFEGDTPLNAERLNHMEAGIEGAYEGQSLLLETATYLNANSMSDRQSSIPRLNALSPVSMTSGQLRLSYFTSDRTVNVNKVISFTNTTAAGATPTLCKYGIFSVDNNGNLTLLAATTNDTTLFAAQNTEYEKNLSTSASLTVNQRYAVGVLIISGSTMPNLLGTLAVSGTALGIVLSRSPRLSGVITGQTDILSSYSSGSVASIQSIPYFEVLA